MGKVSERVGGYLLGSFLSGASQRFGLEIACGDASMARKVVNNNK